MTETQPAAEALSQVRALIEAAEHRDALGRSLPDRSWTPANQRLFLELVAEGETVQSAVTKVGLSVQSAYAFRRTARGQAFALGWRAAALLAREAIADRLMERAIHGQTEVVTRADGSEVTRLRYDNRLAATLLHRLDRQVETAPDADVSAARMVAGEFDAYLDLVGSGAGPARAGLFLARRTAGVEDDPGCGQRDLQPIFALAAADRRLRGGAATADEVEIADLDPARRGDWTAEQWARAEAAGLVALAPATGPQPRQPVATNDAGDAPPERVWWDEFAQAWRTDLAPPEDFVGEQQGRFGEQDYERELSTDEEEVWDAPYQREYQEWLRAAADERDAFFGALSPERSLDPDHDRAAASEPEPLRETTSPESALPA